MMNYEQTKKFIEETAWGSNANETKIMATMLLEIEENLRIANVIKLAEIGLISGEELEALKPELRLGVGLPAQQP